MSNTVIPVPQPTTAEIPKEIQTIDNISQIIKIVILVYLIFNVVFAIYKYSKTKNKSIIKYEIINLIIQCGIYYIDWSIGNMAGGAIGQQINIDGKIKLLCIFSISSMVVQTITIYKVNKKI